MVIRAHVGLRIMAVGLLAGVLHVAASPGVRGAEPRTQPSAHPGILPLAATSPASQSASAPNSQDRQRARFTVGQFTAQPKGADKTRNERLIAQLGSDNWRVREEAQRALIAIGEDARPAVLVALTSPNLEVRIRARLIWARLPILSRFTCSGIVKDASGAPAAGAELAAYYWKDDLVRGSALELIGTCAADAQGRFAFNHPLAAGWPMGFVAARAPGRAAAWSDWEAKNDCTLELTLQKPLPLGGTVADAKGNPVAGASVRAQLLLPTPAGVLILDSLPQCDWFAATTDLRGRFRFENVPPRTRAALLVQAPGYGCVNRRPQVWGWLAQEPAMAGKTDLRIVLPAECAVEGRVLDSASKPVVGAAVNVVNGERFWPAAVTGADGAFRIGGLPAGKFSLRLVAAPGEAGDWTSGFLEVELAAGQVKKNVVLTAAKGGLFEAILLDAADGRPIDKGVLRVCAANDEVPFMTQRYWAGRSNREGLAVVRLPPGTYRIVGGGKDGEYLHHVPSAMDRFTVTEGKRQQIELRLPHMRRIAGTVLDPDGRPVAGAWLTGVHRTGAGVSDATGHFEFASDSIPRSDQPLRLFARHARRNLCALVRVDSDQPAEIRLVPGVRLVGRVVDPEGKPLAGVFVRPGPIVDSGFTCARRDALTDANGRYECPGLPAGLIRVYAQDRQGEAKTELEVKADPKARVRVPDIVLPRGKQ